MVRARAAANDARIQIDYTIIASNRKRFVYKKNTHSFAWTPTHWMAKVWTLRTNVSSKNQQNDAGNIPKIDCELHSDFGLFSNVHQIWAHRCLDQVISFKYSFTRRFQCKQQQFVIVNKSHYSLPFGPLINQPFECFFFLSWRILW